MENRVRKFPKQEERVETGAIQFGDDWPGLFIRGDNCLALFLEIKNLLDKYPELKNNHQLIVAQDIMKTIIKDVEVN